MIIYSHYYDVLISTHVCIQEGVAAFWTGFGAYYGRCAPHAMIILLISERIKVAYLKLFGATK